MSEEGCQLAAAGILCTLYMEFGDDEKSSPGFVFLEFW